jgi:hypothetical protein
MSRSRKGAGPLAQIADNLPARARIGVVLMLADLALAWLGSSPDRPAAVAAVDLCRRWYDGERFDPDRFEEAYAREDGGGVVRGAMNARSQSELAALESPRERHDVYRISSLPRDRKLPNPDRFRGAGG